MTLIAALKPERVKKTQETVDEAEARQVKEVLAALSAAANEIEYAKLTGQKR